MKGKDITCGIEQDMELEFSLHWEIQTFVNRRSSRIKDHPLSPVSIPKNTRKREMLRDKSREEVKGVRKNVTIL